MKKILQTTFLLFFTLVSFSLASQETYTVFGVRGGLGMSDVKGMNEYAARGWIPGTIIITDNPYTATPWFTWDVGLTLQHMRNGLMIQGDFSLSYSNVKLKKVKDPTRIRFSYDNLSVVAGTKIPINDRYRVVIGAGLYFGYDMTALWDGSRSDNPMTFDEVLDAKDALYKNVDFGGSVLAGVEVDNLQFALNYQHGFINIVKDEYPLYNRICKLSVVYFF